MKVARTPLYPMLICVCGSNYLKRDQLDFRNLRPFDIFLYDETTQKKHNRKAMPFDRETAGCASSLNWCSFILLLFATVSSYWTWGWSSQVDTFVNGATATTGPWLAGQLWSNVRVWCNCNSAGVCFSTCIVGSQPVDWYQLTPENACAPSSFVYQKWSGPLRYCKFPDGYDIPATIDANTTVQAPAGTRFEIPHEAISVQGLMISATVLVFIAALLGCIDAGSIRGRRNRVLAFVLALCALMGFALVVSAYSLWSSMEYVTKLQGNAESYMPVWLDQTNNRLGAALVRGATPGPGWSTSIVASILSFFAAVLHCFTLFSVDDVPPKQPQLPQDINLDEEAMMQQPPAIKPETVVVQDAELIPPPAIKPEIQVV